MGGIFYKTVSVGSVDARVFCAPETDSAYASAQFEDFDLHPEITAFIASEAYPKLTFSNLEKLLSSLFHNRRNELYMEGINLCILDSVIHYIRETPHLAHHKVFLDCLEGSLKLQYYRLHGQHEKVLELLDTLGDDLFPLRLIVPISSEVHTYVAILGGESPVYFDRLRINKGPGEIDGIHYSKDLVSRDEGFDCFEFSPQLGREAIPHLQGQNQRLANCEAIALVNALEYLFSILKKPQASKEELKANRLFGSERIKHFVARRLIDVASERGVISSEDQFALKQYLEIIALNKKAFKQLRISGTPMTKDGLVALLGDTPLLVKYLIKLKEENGSEPFWDGFGIRGDLCDAPQDILKRSLTLNPGKWGPSHRLVMNDYRTFVCDYLETYGKQDVGSLAESLEILSVLLKDEHFQDIAGFSLWHLFESDIFSSKTFDLKEIGDSLVTSLASSSVEFPKFALYALNTLSQNPLYAPLLEGNEQLIPGLVSHLETVEPSVQAVLIGTLSAFVKNLDTVSGPAAYPKLLHFVSTHLNSDCESLRDSLLVFLFRVLSSPESADHVIKHEGLMRSLTQARELSTQDTQSRFTTLFILLAGQT